MERLSRFLVPDDRRLSLVGDADGGNATARDPGLLESAPDDLLRFLPHFFRIVLDPAGLREDLLMLELVRGHDLPAVIDQKAPRARRPLIERCYNVRHIDLHKSLVIQ